jgi:hypothetical protein
LAFPFFGGGFCTPSAKSSKKKEHPLATATNMSKLEKYRQEVLDYEASIVSEPAAKILRCPSCHHITGDGPFAHECNLSGRALAVLECRQCGELDTLYDRENNLSWPCRKCHDCPFGGCRHLSQDDLRHACKDSNNNELYTVLVCPTTGACFPVWDRAPNAYCPNCKCESKRRSDGLAVCTNPLGKGEKRMKITLSKPVALVIALALLASFCLGLQMANNTQKAPEPVVVTNELIEHVVNRTFASIEARINASVVEPTLIGNPVVPVFMTAATFLIVLILFSINVCCYPERK